MSDEECQALLTVSSIQRQIALSAGLSGDEQFDNIAMGEVFRWK